MGAPSDPQRPWPPTKFLDFEDTIGTNMGPAKVLTDAGRAFVKPMAEDVNPHALAMELVCTRLAAWFGLPVLDTDILTLGGSDTFERRFRDPDTQPRSPARPGPALATRAVEATRWDGTPEALAALENPGDIALLVIFDTLVRNDDRYPPLNNEGHVMSSWKPNRGNVLLVRDPPDARKMRIVAMDFGRAVIGEGELSSRGLGINQTNEEWVYGLYPEFRGFVTPDVVDTAIERLNRLDRETVGGLVAQIPREWDVGPEAREALVDHLCRRARYLADTIKARLVQLCEGMPGW